MFDAAACSTKSGYHVRHEELLLSTEPEDVFVALFGSSDTAFWLDSSLLVPGLSCWSFMGEMAAKDDSLCYFDATQQLLRVVRPGQEPELITRSVFDHLERVHRDCQLEAAVDLAELPFLGGHVGYFGYELKSLTCGVASHSSRLPDAAFMFCTRFLAFDHESCRLHLVALHSADGADDAAEWLERTRARLENLPKAAPVAAPADPADKVQFRLRHGRAAYLARIERCLQEIAAGETYEVCLTNEISAALSVDPLDLYRVLRRRNPAPYAAFLRFGSLAIASSSPERFLRIDRAGVVETKPIKGTARREADPTLDKEIAEELRNDEKSRAENLMIVDLMRNDLGRVCETGSVHVPSLMHIESYRTVHQLVSTIRGKLRADETIVRCIAACFPGGSMTGAPKIRTLQLIDALEGAPRGVYSGAIGFLSLSGEVDLNIVIRTIVCTPEGVSVGCGGAVVALSDPVAEFEEILLKARAPLSAIAEVATGCADAEFTVAGAEPTAFGQSGQSSYPLRFAEPKDVCVLARAVQALLTELGGPGPQFTLKGAERAAERLTKDEQAGFAVLIEDCQAVETIGIATVSGVQALRAGGLYGVLQELWVAPRYRGADHGARLLQAVEAEASRRGWPMVEVSLPLDGYKTLDRLTRFYEGAGYVQAGMRWRRRL